MDEIVANSSNVLHIEGKDMLPWWLEEIVARMGLSCTYETETRQGTNTKYHVMEMVTNKDDGNAETFDFAGDPIRVKTFKTSLRGQLIQKIPQLSTTTTPSVSDNLPPFQLVYAPMAEVVMLLFKAIPLKELHWAIGLLCSSYVTKHDLRACPHRANGSMR